MTSPGIPRYTGPGVPVTERRAASRMNRGTWPATATSAPHFVTDWKSGSCSRSWYSDLKRSIRRIVEHSAITGLEDQYGSARAPATFDAPGPLAPYVKVGRPVTRA